MVQPQLTPPAPEAYQRLRRALAFVVRMFFRRVEVVGLENIPRDRGGILVAWHPNGLVDPALILSVFPGLVVFGARSGLFRLPLVGRFARAIGTVPIYRRMDTTDQGVEELRRRNEASLDALADRIAAGSFSALFPEGFSHDAPFLQEVKTGAARLYYRSRSRTPPGHPVPVVIPVGLHYDKKRLFRSSALVVFHPPLVLEPDLDVTPSGDADFEETRVLARGLTHQIEGELKSAIMETESWELHRLLHRARKIVRAERATRASATPGASTMDEKVVGMSRIWVGYQNRRATHPEDVEHLRERVRRYDRYLRALGMEDHELDRPPPLPGSRAWLELPLQLLAVFVLLPPLLLIGAVVNLPTAGLVTALSLLFGKEQKDYASLKLMGGIVFFPATWGAWSWLASTQVGRLHDLAPWFPRSPALAAVAAVVLSLLGAVVLLRYLDLAAGTVRAVRVRFTRGLRARALARMRRERSRLCDELDALAAGLELPGVVQADGRVIRRG